MALAFNGSSNTITGLAVGGLPDGVVDTDMLAANAVNKAKLSSEPRQGLAKAWSKFTVTGGTPALDDDFNFSSITDLGAGYFQFNFTNAMVNPDYAALSTSEVGSSNITIPVLQSSVTTNGIRFIYYRITNLAGGGVNVDPPAGAVVVFGDQ